MNDFTEKLIEKKTILAGKVLNVRVDRVLLPNGKETTREVVTHPGAVAVVPRLADGSIIMVRQYRYPVGEMLLEIPAGKLNYGEDPDDCAGRELEEETGYVAGKMTKLGSIYSTPGFSDEILHLYMAEDLRQTAQNLDEDEFLAVETYSSQDIRAMLADNIIQDAKSVAGLLLAGLK
ncbi:MAG: hydrolase [Firmicutes bacterium]|nr:hydrolase [Bacillota bacterium]